MADQTPIEWTDATWNPIGGCTRVSEGCRNCYAEVMAARFSDPGQWGQGLAQRVTLPDGTTDHRWTGHLQLNAAALDKPLRWKKPRRIFVNSTSDLFHEKVPDDWIDQVFAVMALCPQHTFQVLTKRPERMRAYLTGDLWPRIVSAIIEPLKVTGRVEINYDPQQARSRLPLPNVWLGTSVEDQPTADARIPHLLATPAAVRFLSAEPLLGPLDLTRTGDLSSVTSSFPELVRGIAHHMHPSTVSGVQVEAVGTAWQATTYYQTPDHLGGFEVGSRKYPRLDWVIVGGESGPHARPMHPDWARCLRDQCTAAGVAFFFKQWGAFRVTYDRDIEDPDWRICDQVKHRDAPGQWLNLAGGTGFHGERVVWAHRATKASAGRLLDGRTWDQMPGAANA